MSAVGRSRPLHPVGLRPQTSAPDHESLHRNALHPRSVLVVSGGLKSQLVPPAGPRFRSPKLPPLTLRRATCPLHRPRQRVVPGTRPESPSATTLPPSQPARRPAPPSRTARRCPATRARLQRPQSSIWSGKTPLSIDTDVRDGRSERSQPEESQDDPYLLHFAVPLVVGSRSTTVMPVGRVGGACAVRSGVESAPPRR